MARCPYEKIESLSPAFLEIKKLPLITEKKPGIFYIKSNGFLHFHIEDEHIWADVKDKDGFWIKVDVPAKVTKVFIKKFVSLVKEHYLSITEK